MFKRILWGFILSFTVFSFYVLAAPLTYAPAVKNASPAVVNVYILRQTSTRSNLSPYFKGYNRLKPILKNRVVLGSGVIMDKRGYLLTNSHVIRDRNKILVALSDGRTVRAEVVGNDPESDLAVLKIDLKNLPIIAVGNSDKIQVGDVVLAIGNPFGLGRTVTQGIISALGRTAVGLSNIENFIQTDVALNPGSSGGALINTEGQLIGINTGIYTKSGGYQGVSFAIPVNAAENILRQIIKHGSVKRGWLGVEVVKLDPMMVYDLKSKQNLGVVVEKILSDSPAVNKLKVNDIITEVNGSKVRNANGFMSYIAQRKPDETIHLTVYRNHKPETISIQLKARNTEDKLWHEKIIGGKKYMYPDDRI
jgi:Do/DeqQ family serine protease